MAQLFPSDALDFPPVRADGGVYRELDVLRLLQRELDATYCVFHGVDWYAVYNGRDTHGEIDVVVMGPSGNLLLLEIKAGGVEEADDGLYKQYGSQRKDIGKQCRIQFSAMLGRLRQAGFRMELKHALVLPDYRMLGAGSASAPRERVIDADDFADFGAMVRRMLPALPATEEAERVKRFLLNHFQVAPSLDVLQSQLQRATYRLADGLATWVPRLQCPNGALRIQASAGSGKTQLALQLLENAVTAGQQVLYVCYNRPLFDMMRRIAPAAADITTFHQAALAHCRKTSADIDLSQSATWGWAADQYVAAADYIEPAYDVLIVDEGQDFQPAWLNCVRRLLRTGGRLYLLEDDDQRLYGTKPLSIPGETLLTVPDNFRSPRAIVSAINALRLNDHPVRAAGLYQGDVPELLVYDDEDSMKRQIANVIAGYIEAGHGIEDIALLSYRGLGKSVVLAADAVGTHRLCRFAGEHSPTGTPLWNEGELLADSLYRFKGRSAPVVIIVEIDFATINEKERRKLFVGLTRARMAATLLMSRRAEQALAARLGG